MNPFKVFRNRMGAAVRGKAGVAQSTLSREVNPDRKAGQLARDTVQKGEQEVQNLWEAQKKRSRGFRTASTVEGRAAAQTVILPDGYRRKSPVQPVYEIPNYRKKQFLKVVGALVVALALITVVYALLSGPLIL